MEDIETRFNKLFRNGLVLAGIFILGIALLDKFHLFAVINSNPFLLFCFLGVLAVLFGYIFISNIRLKNAMKNARSTDLGTNYFTISIIPNQHVYLRKYWAPFFYPLIKEHNYYFGSAGMMVESKALASTHRSVMSWKNIFDYLTEIRYIKEYSVIILFRNFLSNNNQDFSPIRYLYFSHNQDYIKILVNNDEEAEMVIRFLKNLNTTSGKEITITRT